MRSNDNLKGKKNSAKRQSKSANKAPKQEISATEELYDDVSGAFLLKYSINEKGIGQICLPPSLSMVLQSDQIYISPSGGGLFIRSI
ncbi:MAG: hypothetical protein WB392_04120 [Methanotrichaceae archaeon]